MSPDTAAAVVWAGIAVASAVIALTVAVAVARLRRAATAGPFLDEVVPAPAEGLVRRIAREVLAAPGLALAPLEVAEATGDRARLVAAAGAPLPLVRGLEIVLEVRPQGFDRARVTARSDGTGERRGAARAMALALGLGVPVVAVGGWYLLTHVAGHPFAAVRWQALQVVQAVHVLWPPWLLLWLGRRNQRLLEGSVRGAVQRVALETP